MFGFYTKPVSLGRGGKEGNNAFTQDEDLRNNHDDSISFRDISELDPTPEMIKLLILNNYIDEGDILNNLHLFAWRGNINVIKHYIKKAQETYYCGFNKLHQGAITGELDFTINWFSVAKKASNNDGISPLHFACINPDVSVLRKLYSVNPEYSSQDFIQRKLVHYAAANFSEVCMEFLIAKGIPCNDKDTRGITPLMIAASLGWI